MSSPNGAPADAGPAKSLPPVDAPNVRMILQLFIVPGLLVALIIGFILVFFGGVGTGPQKPAEFLAGLSSLSGQKRQQTAHDLAQILPRKPELRGNVGFALNMSEMLQREMLEARQRKPADPANTELMDLLEYLPAVVGHFQAPVGILLLDELARENADRLHEETARLRFRNALVAIGLLGAHLQEFDAAAPAEQDRLITELEKEAGDKPGRPTWARLAADYLKERRAAQSAGIKGPLKDLLGVVGTLAIGARSRDEMSRKLTILALANWHEAGTDELLREMTNPSGIDIWENNDQQRGLREIRYNAALALARRGSALTPEELILESLDEQKLRQLYPNDDTSPVTPLVLKALRDLQQYRKSDPEGFAKKTNIRQAVNKLAGSDSVAIRVEATRVLGEAPVPPPQPASFSRQMMLMIGVAGSIVVFLGIAVLARWRKKPEPLKAAVPATA